MLLLKYDPLGQAHACTRCTLTSVFPFHFPSHNKPETHLLTLSPDTVGRSVSGELAVILCAAMTPGQGRHEDLETDVDVDVSDMK